MRKIKEIIKKKIKEIFFKEKVEVKVNTFSRTRSGGIGSLEETEVPLDQDVQIFNIESVFEQQDDEEKIEEQLATIPNTEIVGQKLMIKLPQNCQVKYVVLSQEEIVKQPRITNTINLEKDDIVFIMTYNKKEVCMEKYQVIDIKAQNNSIHTGVEKLNHINQINLCDIPQPVKRELRNFFHLVGKPSQIA